jgi:hypothetical protein
MLFSLTATEHLLSLTEIAANMATRMGITPPRSSRHHPRPSRLPRAIDSFPAGRSIRLFPDQTPQFKGRPTTQPRFSFSTAALHCRDDYHTRYLCNSAMFPVQEGDRSAMVTRSINSEAVTADYTELCNASEKHQAFILSLTVTPRRLHWIDLASLRLPRTRHLENRPNERSKRPPELGLRAFPDRETASR